MRVGRDAHLRQDRGHGLPAQAEEDLRAAVLRQAEHPDRHRVLRDRAQL